MPFSFYVLVAPTSVEIVGHRSGSKIHIRENQEIELTCQVANSKPKADIVWYRRNVRFVADEVEESEEDGSLDGRKTVISKIKFRTTARDNQAPFSCEARHPAILSQMRSSVVLSVLCKRFLFFFDRHSFFSQIVAFFLSPKDLD